ncbi:cytochrome P450 315a1, mitochondrial [Scaptodrosophila lebanonensis]|uniref:Cytochrome P450 315a1, mitochondrial n=1 Tax=Drosophila lebanonensis TaxID=7225 RepID=A0A6J2THR0_DROLE|nr:cytochrome P450 315a1, mitochondrial [Scaptodrosophila lebanonensis]
MASTLVGLLRSTQSWLRTLLLKVLWHLKGELKGGYRYKQQQRIAPVPQKYAPIPRVKGLPLVGTLFDLIRAGGAQQLHKYIDARHRQYGPIFRERLGGTQDCVFVSSATLMRSVFLHEGQHPQHPLPEAWTLYNKLHACQRGLFFMEGAEWYHNRRILNRLLLNGNLNWMDVHIESITQKLVERWCLQTQAVIGGSYELPQLEEQLYRWSIEVVCGIMFGSSSLTCENIQAALDNFTLTVHKMFEHSSLLMNFPPKLAQLLRLRIWRDFEQNVDLVLKQSSNIIELFIAKQQPRESRESGETDTLYQRLLASELPIELIRRIFVDLVIAAGDTTAFSSQWALYALGQQPDLQHRMAKELELANPTKSLLLHGLIKEALRLYPVAPFIGRYLPQDVELGGHFIEKKTLVLLSLYTAGRDPTNFEEPLSILPERWSPQSELLHQSHGSLPFAIGQRSCIGRRVALKQLHVLLGVCTTKFQMQCLNERPVDCVLRMVTVPSETLRLALKLRQATGS